MTNPFGIEIVPESISWVEIPDFNPELSEEKQAYRYLCKFIAEKNNYKALTSEYGLAKDKFAQQIAAYRKIDDPKYDIESSTGWAANTIRCGCYIGLLAKGVSLKSSTREAIKTFRSLALLDLPNNQYKNKFYNNFALVAGKIRGKKVDPDIDCMDQLNMNPDFRRDEI